MGDRKRSNTKDTGTHSLVMMNDHVSAAVYRAPIDCGPMPVIYHPCRPRTGGQCQTTGISDHRLHRPSATPRPPSILPMHMSHQRPVHNRHIFLPSRAVFFPTVVGWCGLLISQKGTGQNEMCRLHSSLTANCTCIFVPVVCTGEKRRQFLQHVL